MQTAFATHSLLRQITAQVILAVFLCLSLLPSGFMPSFASNGDATITICAGLDQQTITLDEQGQPTHQVSSDVCAFFVNATATPATSPVLVAQPVLYTATLSPTPDSVIIDQFYGRANGARAPPITL